MSAGQKPRAGGTQPCRAQTLDTQGWKWHHWERDRGWEGDRCLFPFPPRKPLDTHGVIRVPQYPDKLPELPETAVAPWSSLAHQNRGAVSRPCRETPAHSSPVSKPSSADSE